MTRPVAAIILAAGKGTRMKSDLHKVLHPIAGRPMLAHLLHSVEALAPAHKVVIVGSGRAQVEPLVAAQGGVVAVQDPQHGTAHAVQQAEAALAGFDGDVLILYGDVPFVSAETMRRMLDRLAAPDAPAAVVLAFRPPDPAQYGRILADADGTIRKMVEHKDARAHRFNRKKIRFKSRSYPIFTIEIRVQKEIAILVQGALGDGVPGSKKQHQDCAQQEAA